MNNNNNSTTTTTRRSGEHVVAVRARSASKRRVVAVAAFCTAVALAFGITGADTASAYRQVAASGYPGSVTGPDIFGSWNNGSGNSVMFPWRIVTESARYANYDQYVCVTMNLVSSSAGGQWGPANTSTNCAWIPWAATSANVNGFEFTGLQGLNSFIYAGNVTVTWRLSNGVLIGYRTLDYNATADYTCSTFNCQIGMTNWGGGAYLTFPSL